MSSYSFRAFNPATGALLQYLPDYSSAQISMEYSDVGALSLKYPRQGLNFATLLTDRVEIGAFLDDVEMDDGRFMVQVSKYDEVKDDDIPEFTGVSLLQLLKKAIVYSGTGSTTVASDQVFNTATPGGILRALFQQNSTRGGVMSVITWASFTNTTDSNGNAWANSIGNITYTVGVNYLDIVRNMVDNGLIEVKMVGRDLRIYNPGTMGTDRTVGGSPVTLRKGLDFLEAPTQKTVEQIASTALIEGDEDRLLQVHDASVAAAWGRLETYISQGGIKDSTTLGVLAQAQIDLAKQARQERTRKVHNLATYQPYTHYRVSDYIYSDTTGTPERLRLRQLVLEVDQAGVQNASIVLNDKFLEREIAIARKVNGILGGASAGGSIAVPLPLPPEASTDTTIPKAPASVSATSAFYVEDSGRTRSQATVSWPAVTQNTDNSTLADLDHYETQWRSDTTISTTDSSTLGPGRELASMTRKFDRRGKGYGWLGADGGCSTRAPSGKDFWAFADTNLGTADESGRIQSGTWSFINNSFVLTDVNDTGYFDARWGFGNRLSSDDAFLKTGIGFWQADANCSVARSTSTGYYGTTSLQVTATAAGDATARLAGGAFAYPGIVAGKTYHAMARARSVGTARQVALAIRWYDASNALISTTTGTNAAGSTTAWLKYRVSGVAPANAVKAAVIIIFRSATAAQVFNATVFQLADGDGASQGWNDPGRASLGGPMALWLPEEMGGTVLTDYNDILWVDACFTANSKVYVFLNRYSKTGTWKQISYLAELNGTTYALEDMVMWMGPTEAFVWSNFTYMDGTYLFVAGVDETAHPNRTMHLLRVPLANIKTGTKEYRTGVGTWSTTRSASVGIVTLYAGVPGGCVKIGGVWYMPYTVYGEGKMRILQCADLTNTWADTGPMYDMPQTSSNLVAYFARIHPQLLTTAGMPMSYSVNGTVNGDDSTKNIRNYAPKFLIGPPASVTPAAPTAPWSDVRIVDSGTTVDYIGDLNPGYSFQARVRAADYNGNKGAWTSSAPITISNDTTPPNKPSTPIVSSAFQGIRIEWDGLDFQGGPPPGDWWYTEVHVSEIADFTPGTTTYTDYFRTRDGGVTPLQGLVYGRTYYVRFVMVDVRGNRSVPSDVASTTPEQLVDVTEIANKLITGAKIADASIFVKNLTVANFEPNIVPNGGFEEEATNADGVGVGTPYGWLASGWTWGAGGTMVRDTAAPLGGAASLKVTAATVNDGMIVRSIKFPVTGTKLFAVSAEVRVSRNVTNNNVIGIQVATGVSEADAGSSPGANSVWTTGTYIPGGTGATTQTIEQQVIVPAGHKYATVHLINMQALDGLGGYDAFWDDISVLPVGGSAFIADASILNAKIANLAVDNAKIANVSVGKLTAGILSADMTVSARIKTADTGARVELNSSGLQAYNSSGSQTVSISAATGSVSIAGLLRTGLTGSRIIMQSGGDFPLSTIYFYPVTGSDYAWINSPEDAAAPGTTTIGVNTGIFTSAAQNCRQQLYMAGSAGIFLRQYRVSDGATWGGRLFIGESIDLQIGTNLLYMTNPSGQSSTLISMDYNMTIDAGRDMNLTGARETTTAVVRMGWKTGSSEKLWYISSSGIRIWGNYQANITPATNQALVIGDFTIASGTSWSYSYGATLAQGHNPQVTLRLNTAIGNALTAATLSGFTVATTNTGAGVCYYATQRTD